MDYLNNVGILGAGNWGTMLAVLASHQASKVFLYERDTSCAQKLFTTRENKKYLPGVQLPQNIIITSRLSEVFQECLLIMPVIPASSLRGFAQQFAPYTRGDHLLLHGIKGLEPVTFKRMSEILAAETACLRIGALAGPNLAGEFAQGLMGGTVIASHFSDVIEVGTRLLSSTQLRIVGSNDLIGVEWAGALKNILALAAGLLSELKAGQNTLALALTQGLQDIQRLIHTQGAHTSTLLGLAGIGDIFATCSSPLSRNFQAGQRLARGMIIAQIEQELAMTVEGFNTLKVAVSLGEKNKIDLPFFHTLFQVAFESLNAHEAFKLLNVSNTKL